MRTNVDTLGNGRENGVLMQARLVTVWTAFIGSIFTQTHFHAPLSHSHTQSHTHTHAHRHISRYQQRQFLDFRVYLYTRYLFLTLLPFYIYALTHTVVLVLDRATAAGGSEGGGLEVGEGVGLSGGKSHGRSKAGGGTDRGVGVRIYASDQDPTQHVHTHARHTHDRFAGSRRKILEAHGILAGNIDTQARVLGNGSGGGLSRSQEGGGAAGNIDTTLGAQKASTIAYMVVVDGGSSGSYADVC